MAVAAQQLFKAIQHDDQAAVKRALNLNPSLVHAKHTRVAYTPLHSAAALGNLQLLRELLHHRASCQSADSNNETPLHVAARQVGCCNHTFSTKVCHPRNLTPHAWQYVLYIWLHHSI